MTTIVDLKTSRSLSWTTARPQGHRECLFALPLKWRLVVQGVAIDHAAFRTALPMWHPRTAVAVDDFHLISLAQQATTRTRQNLRQRVKGRRTRANGMPWIHRMLLLRTGPVEVAAAAKTKLQQLIKNAVRPWTNGLYRNVRRRWEKIEVLIITVLRQAGRSLEHRRQNIKRTDRRYLNAANYKSVPS